MKIKKILCLIMALSVILTSVNLMAVSASADEGQSVTTSKSELAYGLTKALKILPDTLDTTEDLSEKNVTRGEFVTMAVKMMNYPEPKNKTSQSEYFTDLDESNAWAIDVAASLDLISSGDYGLFFPNKEITANEACKILVCLLGYKVLASTDEDWTVVYNRYAAKLGLYEGVRTAGGNSLSWNDCVQMIYNALDADVLSVGHDTTNLQTGETLLKQYFDIEYDEGIIGEASGASIFNKEGNITGKVAYIGDRSLATTGIDLTDYIGYNVRYYYTSDLGDETLVYFCPWKNAVKKVVSKDLDEFSNKKYTYDDNGKSRNLTLADGYTVVYNGRLLTTGFDIDYYMPKSGYIKAVDNDSDGKYEVIFVWDFINRVVSSINTTDQYITFDYEGTGITSLDLDGKDVNVYTFDGVESSVSEIKDGNVLSIAASGKEDDDDRFYTIYVSAAKLSGELTAMNDDDEYVITVGDEEKTYTIEQNEENRYRLDTVKEGALETFYVSYMGEIFAVAGSIDSNFKTALLMSSYISEDDENLFIKVLSTGNSFVTLECAEKFTVSGSFSNEKPTERTSVFVKNVTQGQQIFKNINGTNTINEIIRYKLNDDGKVVNIELPVPCYGTDAEGNVDLTGDGLHYIVKDFTSLNYTSHSNAFISNTKFKTLSDVILLDTSKTFFTIPAEESSTLSIKQQYAATGSLSNDKNQTVKLYATNGNSKIADIIMIQGDAAGSVSDTAGVMAVTSVGKVVNDSGDLVWQIELNYKGSKSTYQTDDESILSGISKGDLIRMTVDASGGIGKLEQVLHYDSANNTVKVATSWAVADGTGFSDNGKPVVTDASATGSLRKFIFGAVYENVNNRVIVALEKELDGSKTSVEPVSISSFSGIQVFDGKNWTTATTADIYAHKSSGRYSFLFARLNYANAGELYIYNLDD